MSPARTRRHVLSPSDRVRLALEQAQGYWGVDPRSPGRKSREVRARWSAAYALRVGCGLSLNEVANILGCEHTTVVYACRRGVEVAKLEGWWPWLEHLTLQLRGL